MTLLQSITKAAAAAAVSVNPSPPSSNFPVILNPLSILPNSTPIPNSSQITPLSQSPVSEFDSNLTQLSTDFLTNLKSKLQSPKPLKKADFLKLYNNFLNQTKEKTGLNCASEAEWIQKLSPLIKKDVWGVTGECCAVLGLWNLLEILLNESLIVSSTLVEKLVEKKQTALVILSLKKINNFGVNAVVSVLKYFLSPSKDCYDSMVGIRKEWEKQADLAVEIVKEENGLCLAKEAAVLLMMGHDGFSSSEICLHYLFGPENVDELVMSSAVSRLNGFEVLGLVRYFVKWLEKYERFPQARQPQAEGCRLSMSELGLTACESVPSVGAVVKGLGLVLGEHFSYMVLNSEFHDELRVVERVVGSLVSEADLCCPVDDVIKHLQ